MARLIAKKNSLKKIACAIAFVALACPGFAQTFQLGPNSQVKQQGTSGQQLGWGSNIQNARLARAAQMALQKGDHALALDYAQRAAQAAPNDPQIWFLVGYTARLDQRYGQSVSAFEHGLRLDPTSINGQSGLAQTYAQMGRIADAERLLKKVVTADPRQEDDLLTLGSLYLQAADYNNAIQWLGQAERVSPNARAELLLAIAYEHEKKMDEASRYLHLAISRAPNNPDVQRSLAGYYRSQGDYGKAIDLLKAIKNSTPDIQGELAYTYQLAGKPQQAATLYTQAANALPRDLSMQLSAAQAQVGINNIDGANQFLSRAAALNPNYYRLHAIRAEIAQMQDKDAEAAQQYSQAVANLPPSPIEGPLYGIQLHMDLVSLYTGLDEEDQAHQQLQIAQSQISALNLQGPDRPAFLRLRALIEMDGGQTDAALNDMKESLALSPNDPNSLLLDGDVLMKLNRTQDAIAVYRRVLSMDPRSRFALTSLGYAERAANNNRQAERYFEELARDYPSLYVPYLALGDMYTALDKYPRALQFYSKGYSIAPSNAMIVAGGINAAIEAHEMKLAGTWISRVTPKMESVPKVLAQKERYYAFDGRYQESADFGEQAIKAMPRNRDVVVYLGYDLLNLGRYQELLALTHKYMDVFPKEPDIPLLAGYAYKHDNDRHRAVEAFSEALKRDPTVVTAYVNRGYVYNDLLQPHQAIADFEQALRREPKNGQAHLGLAFADLQLNRNGAAIRQSELAQSTLGDSEMIHMIRATGYGRQGLLSKAALEYKAAIKFAPTDGSLYLDLGTLYFSQLRYRDAVQQLQYAQKYLPEDAEVYAVLARSYAGLQDKPAAMRNIALAEKYAGRNQNPASQPAAIYVATGEAFSTLGDQHAAMQRFSQALVAPKSNRVDVRLAISQLMEQQGHSEEAQRELALAQMDAEAGYTQPITGTQYIRAAGILQQMHEYHLSEDYLQRAKTAGAPDVDVRVSLANDYLALGDTRRAAAELSAVNQADGSRSDYAYLLAEANLYQQEHRSANALSAFAQAASASGEDQTADQSLLQAGASEGYRLDPFISILSNLIIQPIYDDSTVYVLDAKTFGNPPAYTAAGVNTSLLPPPRSSLDTEWTTAYHLHVGNGALPLGGFFQLRDARGTISIPATGIVNRNTIDTSFNFGAAPTFHLGNNALTFNGGVQETIRRDTLSPRQMDQNITRIFAFISTSSFMNAVSVSGYFIHDFGPFTNLPLNESTVSGSVDFRVGAPWSKTALLTGWGSNDQHFNSHTLGNTENYYTSSYIGLSRSFSSHLSIEAIAEDIRSWRVVPYVSPSVGTIVHSGIAQALRPAATVNIMPNHNWDIQFTGAYENTRSFHTYDMTQNGFSVSYMRPLSRTFNEKTGEVHLKYPIRFSAGIQEQTFLNFTSGQNTELRPYVSINLF